MLSYILHAIRQQSAFFSFVLFCYSVCFKRILKKQSKMLLFIATTECRVADVLNLLIIDKKICVIRCGFYQHIVHVSGNVLCFALIYSGETAIKNQTRKLYSLQFRLD